MSNDKILNQLKSFEHEDKLKLTETIPYIDHEIPGLVKILKYCYESNNPIIQKLGTLINSIFWHQQPIFIMTRPMFIELIKKDKNISHSSINSRSYNKVMAKARIEFEWIVAVREYQPGKAGLYGLTNSKLTDGCLVNYMERLMGKTQMQARIEQGIDNYDKSTIKLDPKEEEEDLGPMDPDMQEFLKKTKVGDNNG